jgi:hypothetical protein
MHKEKHAEHHEHHSGKQNILQKGILILLMSVIFTAIFAAAFYATKQSSSQKFDAANKEALGIKNYGSPDKVKNIFSKYGALMGAGLGLIALIAGYIIYGIAAITRLTKTGFAVTGALFITYGLMLVLGTELAFFENRYSTAGNGIIFFLGYPLFYTGIITSAISLLLIIAAAVKKRD